MRVADLFCGMGSFTKSFEALGMQSVFACDVDPTARAHYKLNFQHDVQGDIKTIDMQKVPAFDVLTAGFPCQSFSSIGNQRGKADARGNLFFDTLKFMDRKPKFAIFENVRAILLHEAFMKQMRAEITSRGYKIHEKVLLAADYGSPQKRNRLFLVAVRDDLQCGHFFPLEKDVVALNDLFTDKNFIFERNFCNTIRCGGRGGRIEASHNWVKYWVRRCELHATREQYTLTLRDCQRIQGFADYSMFGFKKDQWRLLGNTIPTCFTHAIGARILQVLDEQRPLKKRKLCTK